MILIIKFRYKFGKKIAITDIEKLREIIKRQCIQYYKNINSTPKHNEELNLAKKKVITVFRKKSNSVINKEQVSNPNVMSEVLVHTRPEDLTLSDLPTLDISYETKMKEDQKTKELILRCPAVIANLHKREEVKFQVI